MKKSLLSMVSFVLMCTMILAACGGSNNNPNNTNDKGAGSTNTGGSNAPVVETDKVNKDGFPIVNDQITLNVMGYRNPIQSQWEDMHFFQEMEKMTNVKLTFDTPAADGYTEAKNLSFTSDNLPDFFFGGRLTASDESKYGAQGLIIPLEDLIEEYAPNIQKMFEEMPEVKKSITSTDGHIYALPGIQTADSAKHSPLWINGEWLENTGITTAPETTEEFYQMLKTFVDKDANQNGERDELPLSGEKPNGALTVNVYDMILNGFGLLGRDIQEHDGKVFYGVMHDNYKEWLRYMSKLYSEGLIDPETYTQGGADVTARGYADLIGVTLKARPELAWEIEDEADIYKFPMTPALTSEFSSTKMYNKRSGISRGAFAITHKNPNPEATIRWIDYIYSQEGSLFLHYGPENMFWEYADKEKGIRKQIPQGDMNMEEFRGTITPDVGTDLPKWVRPEAEYNWVGASAQHRIAEATAKLIPYGKVPYPDVYFTDEEQQILDVSLTDIQTFISQSEAQFVTGQKDVETEYDSFISTLEKMNIKKVEEVYQAAYDRWFNS